MSDLVKLLRSDFINEEALARPGFVIESYIKERRRAADRIEQLEKYQSLHAQSDKATLEVEQKLVNRLRDAHKRIEALEAALRDIVDRLVVAFPAMEEFPPIQKARTALGEKKDDSHS